MLKIDKMYNRSELAAARVAADKVDGITLEVSGTNVKDVEVTAAGGHNKVEISYESEEALRLFSVVWEAAFAQISDN